MRTTDASGEIVELLVAWLAQPREAPRESPVLSVDRAGLPNNGPHLLLGVTVLELGNSVAAPFAGEILGDLGADVIKVEKCDDGDDARKWGPPFWHGTSAIFQSLNRNKRSVIVELRDRAENAQLKAFIVAHYRSDHSRHRRCDRHPGRRAIKSLPAPSFPWGEYALLGALALTHPLASPNSPNVANIPSCRKGANLKRKDFSK
jgi:CoA-transferase family III